MNNGVLLITYPDSLGNNLTDLQNVMDTYFKDVFESVHILPPFPSTGDRGFAPTTYLEIEKTFGTFDNISDIAKKYNICLDMMVNHVSRKSEYFLDYQEKGDASEYKDCFITLDKLWSDGVPKQEDINKMFLRRETPYSIYNIAGKDTAVWTTFGKTEVSEQVDVDVNSPKVMEMFERNFENFSKYGVKIVRLDAVGYVTKKIGTSCFFVEPEISQFIEKISNLAKAHNIVLLPEVHANYEIQKKLASEGYYIYDFILPYTVLEALLLGECEALHKYLNERPHNQFTTLDCHDGIPLKPDLDGIVDVQKARKVVDICLERGGNLSKVISKEHMSEDGFDVHQIRGTYFSLLNNDENDYFIARAIQIFTPGIPQVYYVGALAGANDYERGEKMGDGRELNRHNYSFEEIEKEISRPIVKQLLELFKLRNTHKAFDGEFTCEKSGNELTLAWDNNGEKLSLVVDFATKKYEIK